MGYFPDNSPNFWRFRLTNQLGRSHPWLWDIDVAMCKAKDLEPLRTGTTKWDWERLVRALAQKDVFEPGGSMADGVPLGLRNRRRIWRMIEDIGIPDDNGAHGPDE